MSDSAFKLAEQQEQVTRDFESVAPSLVTDNVKFEKRSLKIDQENKRRMEEWQREQDRVQQV